MRNVALAFASLVLAAPATAHLGALDQTTFAKQPKVAACHAELLEIENYAAYFSIEWTAPVPRDKVIKSLRDCRKVVAKARKDDASIELVLFAGLIDAYLYNFDEPKTFDTALEAFKVARTMDATDTRADWFSANHLAGSNHGVEAMELFQGMQRRLPPEANAWTEFWIDYARAAHNASMPASALLALDNVAAATGALPDWLQVIADRAHETLLPSDPTKDYAVNEVWAAFSLSEQQRRIFSPPYGISMVAPTDWETNPSVGRAGNGALHFRKLVATADGRNAGVNMVVLAVAEPPKRSLHAEAMEGPKEYVMTREEGYSCPVPGCVAYRGLNTECKKTKGFECSVFTVVFERSPPKNPGVAIEFPIPLPQSEGTGYKIYRPIPRLTRFAVPIRYKLIVEVPAYGYGEGRGLFDELVKTLIVE